MTDLKTADLETLRERLASLVLADDHEVPANVSFRRERGEQDVFIFTLPLRR